MNEVFYEWINRSEENSTWMTLIETLRADSIGERQLASELEGTFN
jgi:acyl carrier protein